MALLVACAEPPHDQPLSADAHALAEALAQGDAARCADIGAPEVALQCTLALAEADQAGLCDPLSGSAGDACRFGVAVGAGNPALCARAGGLKLACWEAVALTDPGFAAEAEPEAMITAVTAALEAAGLPADHQLTWLRALEPRLALPPSVAQCAPYQGTPAEDACAMLVARRAELWCRNVPGYPEGFLAASGLDDLDAWLPRPVASPALEALAEARFAAMGLPPDTACAWERLYEGWLRRDEPVLSARCDTVADPGRRARCVAAVDQIFTLTVRQAAGAGDLPCEGPAAGRLKRAEDPRLLAVMAQERAAGRCGGGGR